MSFDRRIRQELERAAEMVDADIERNLGAVEARVRSRQGLSPTLLLATVTAIVVLALVRLMPAATPDTPGGASPTPAGPSSSRPASPAEDAIAGTWLVSLPASNEAVQQQGVVGDWTLRLQPDGVALLSAPSSFAGGAGTLSGITFSISGDQFRTDVFYNDFCSSIATYSWSRRDGALTLTPISEDCAKRRALLATAPWIEVP
jgi:hypothetical protein